MWLVSCRRQGMLTQGPTPDPKCKVDISFLTLPHLLDCLICTRNSITIVLLLQMMGAMGYVGSGWFITRCRRGDKEWVLSCSFVFVFVLCSVMSSVRFFKWLVHDSCCVCFFIFYFFSSSLFPLTRSYWCIEIVVSLM